MAIYRLLENHRLLGKPALGHDDINRIVSAYEHALKRFYLQNSQTDPLNQAIAKYVIEAALTGEQDPAQICVRALERFADEIARRLAEEN